MEFKDEYRIQADKHEVSNDVLIQTKNKIKELQKPKRSFAIKTLVLAAVLITCMCVTAFAYEYHKYRLTNNSAGTGHEYLYENDCVQEINKTTKGENISATIKDVKADAENMYITVLLKTTDGSDLNINTDECISLLERQGFEAAYFVVNNQNIDFTSVFRTDDGSNSTEATLELVYFNFSDTVNNNSSISIESLMGKEISVVLENYQYKVICNSSINFTYNDVGSMIDKEGLALDSELSEVGTLIKYADGTTIPTYTLNAGNKKIYFSDKYSKTYIDNMGIFNNGEAKTKQLYISIVPESEEVKEELISALSLLNVETGEYISGEQPYIGDSDGGMGVKQNEDGTYTYTDYDGRYVQPDDGRIIFIFNAGIDIYNEINECYGVDTTTDLLKDFTFVYKNPEETKTVQNTWNINFTLENVNATLNYNIEKNIQKDGVNANINKVEIGDSYLNIEGNADTGFDFKIRGEIYLILKDGTKVNVGQKMGGGYDESTGEFNIEGDLKTLVDADDVVAIELWDQIIDLK